MNKPTAILSDIDMPVTTEETLGSTTVLNYLGLTLNFKLQLIGIPEKKWLKCLTLLNHIIQAYLSKWKTAVDLK